MPHPLKPVNNWVIIRRHAPADREGEILIPEQARDKPYDVMGRGTVLAIGPGKRLDDGTRAPMGVAVGDVVLVHPLLGHEIEFKGEKLHMVEEDGIPGVVNEVEVEV